MGIFSRIFGGKQKAAEGAYRPGPYLLDGGWLSASAGRLMNWWQTGVSLAPGGEGADQDHDRMGKAGGSAVG